LRAIALADLDDTLFQSRRKCPAGLPEEALLPLGFDRDGMPLSFATPRQQSFLAWLSESSCVVPVTARSRNALERVRIDWDYAICAHGGLILTAGGSVDRDWSERTAELTKSHEGELRGLSERLSAQAPATLSVRLLEESGRPLYVLAKLVSGAVEVLRDFVARAAQAEVPAGWTVHHNGTNAAFLPPFLSKRSAVEYLLPRLRASYPDVPAIGIGDSVSDAGFMALCDFAMMPSGSQLAAHSLLKAL
jgi:hypothetical protein